MCKLSYSDRLFLLCVEQANSGGGGEVMEAGTESTSSAGAQQKQQQEQQQEQQEGSSPLDHVMQTSSHDETLRDHYSFIHNVAQFYNSQELSDVTIKVAID